MLIGPTKSGPRRRGALLLALAAAVLAPATLAGGSGAAGPAFPPLDLGTLGGAASEAVAINDAGQVIGWSTTAAGGKHAFSWTSAGGMVDLGSLGGESSAVVVNEAGAVAGSSTTASGVRHAFFWSQATGMLDLGTLGVDSTAVDLNDAGMVVGHGTTATGTTRAFAWLRRTGMVDLGTLGGTDAVAADVSNTGTVVGWSTTASGERHAFLWTHAGGMVDFLPGGCGFTSATAVSDGGQVIGTRCSKAFSWTQAGGGVDLQIVGQLFIPLAAYDVNEAGQVIGSSGPAVGLAPAGLLWQRDGSGAVVASGAAADLNDGGQVVGVHLFSGRLSPGHAFAWTPASGRIDLGTLGGAGSSAAAVNSVGQIAGSSEVVPGVVTTHATLWEVPAPPTSPLSVGAVARDGHAVVSFASPASAGGSPIAYYTATTSPGGLSASGLESPITLYGLENGTSYTFTVTGTNGFGTSPPSMASAPVVPQGEERDHPAPPPGGDRPTPPGPVGTSSPRPTRPPR